MNMFDNRGELNASSARDLLVQLQKYASILQDNQPSNAGLAGHASLSEDRIDQMINRAIYTQDGKVALAQSMANPIN